MPSPNYVKFQRGLKSIYDSMKANSTLDNNTLYFVYEQPTAGQQPESGSLYMGETLISSNASADLPESLETLSTILTDEAAVAFLVRDSSGEWKAGSVDEVKELLNISSGVSDSLTIDTNEFVKVDSTLKLKGFDDAANNTFLKKVDGAVSWVAVEDYSDDITSLQSSVGTLETTVSGLSAVIDSKIAAANHLSYSVVEELPESSLAKTNVIYLLSNDSGDISDSYDEYMFVNSNFEKVGVKSSSIDVSNFYTKAEIGTLLDAKASASDLTAVDGRLTTVEGSIATLQTTVGTLATTSELQAVSSSLDNYVLTSTFNSVVGTLSDFNDYEDGVTNTIIDELNVLSDRVDTINDRLIWQELT